MNKLNSFRSILTAMLLVNASGSINAMEETKIGRLSIIPESVLLYMIFDTDAENYKNRIKRFKMVSTLAQVNKYLNTLLNSEKIKNKLDAQKGEFTLANLYNKTNNTFPLWDAIRTFDVERFRQLVNYGANINQTINRETTNSIDYSPMYRVEGNTLLHFCVFSDHVSLLLELGANPFLENSEGRTAKQHLIHHAELAKAAPNEDIIALFEEYEKKWEAKQSPTEYLKKIRAQE